MLKDYDPRDYLSKRENGTYCVISGGMPLNAYTTKTKAVHVADVYGIELPDVVWDALTGSFILE